MAFDKLRQAGVLSVAAMALLTAVPAAAQDAAPSQGGNSGLRDLCPTRPGIGTPSCIVDAGHLQVEVGLGDWTRDDQADSRTDSVSTGDFLLRYGLDSMTEAQLGWTAYTHIRTLDRMTGAVSRMSGIGDLQLGLKHSFLHPDGSGTSVAIQPFVTMPVGSDGIGAGDWGAGVLLPIGLSIGSVSLNFTPEVDAVVDADGHGRHLAYSNVVGLGFNLTPSLNLTTELSAFRDEDPSGHTTQLLAGLSLAWKTGRNTQLDVGTNIGLNDDAPDAEVYFGVSHRF